MKQLLLKLCVVFLFISCNENGNVNTKDLFSFKLASADTSQYDFSVFKKNKASVFIFLAPDCPLSQNYTLTLNNLQEQFKINNILFYGIIPGNSFNKNEVNDFVDEYKISFPVMMDTDFNLTSYFDASKTPEVFVVNPDRIILYKGAIDNWSSDLGVHRSVISANYLQDALNSIVENTEVKIKETKAVGCFIERKRKG